MALKKTDFPKTCFLTYKKDLEVTKKTVILQRYPEYNLFTLKKANTY